MNAGRPGADVDLDGDAAGLEAVDGEGGDAGEHGRHAAASGVTDQPPLCAPVRRPRAWRVAPRPGRRAVRAREAGLSRHARPPASRPAMSTDPRDATSDAAGEQLALEHLERSATRSSPRNHRTARGELDLVVSDGERLVFVEVKTRARAATAPERRAGTPCTSPSSARSARPRPPSCARRRPAAVRVAALRRDRRRHRPARAASCASTTSRGRSDVRSADRADSRAAERQLLVRRRLERHAVQRRDADALDRRRGARAWSSRRARANSQPGWRSSARCMKRSRVTLAMIEAAAIAALVASPSTTARCSKPEVGDREAVGQAERARHARRRSSASRSAARFVLCRPRSSIPRTQRETTATRVGACAARRG